MTGDTTNNIRLLFVDLDGTLLNSDSEITPNSLVAVEQCTKAGISVVMATARPPRSSKAYYEQLKLDTPSIHYNGAIVHDFATGSTLLHHPMSGALAKELSERAIEIDASAIISLEVSDNWYMNRRSEDLLTRTEREGFAPDHVGDLEPYFDEPVTKVLISFPKTSVDDAEARLSTRLGERLVFTRSEEWLLQVMDAGVSKGAAAEFMMKTLGVRRDKVAAIGDAPNDIPMFDAARLSIAMANGYAEVRSAADHVTLSNDEDGVAVAIRKWILDANR